MSPRRGSPMRYDQLVDDQPILILERRRHALAFDARHLEPERDDEDGVDGRRDERLDPGDELFLNLRERMPGLVRRRSGAVRVGGGDAGTPVDRHDSWAGRRRRARRWRSAAVGLRRRSGRLQLQVLPEPPRLRAAHRDFRRLLVLHPQDVVPAEPRDDLLDLVDVHQMRPVHAPEDAPGRAAPAARRASDSSDVPACWLVTTVMPVVGERRVNDFFGLDQQEPLADLDRQPFRGGSAARPPAGRSSRADRLLTPPPTALPDGRTFECDAAARPFERDFEPRLDRPASAGSRRR